MPDKLLKPASRQLDRTVEQVQAEEKPGQEVAETSKSVIEGLNVLPEQAAEGGAYDEKKEKAGTQSGTTSKTGAMTDNTQIGILPPIDEMIRQTEQAIESEMKQTQEEMNSLLRSSKSSLYDINDKVKRIRFLQGLLNELKKAARMAEDFIVNLWKQYVKKAN